MLNIGRQQSRAAGFDTAFVPGAPYFIVAPDAPIRREGFPPFLRKRIGFEQLKVVPIRWPTINPGGRLYGTDGRRYPLWMWGLAAAVVVYFLLYTRHGRSLWRRRGS